MGIQTYKLSDNMAISEKEYIDLKEYWDYQRKREYNKEQLRDSTDKMHGRLFTGNSLQVLDSTAGSLHIHGGTAGGRLAFRGTTTSASTGIAEVFAFWDTNKVAGMVAQSGTDTTNKEDANL